MSTSAVDQRGAEPVLFLNTPEHEVNADGYAQVVSPNDRYVIVEKLGNAACVVERLDPRDRDEEVA